MQYIVYKNLLILVCLIWTCATKSMYNDGNKIIANASYYAIQAMGENVFKKTSTSACDVIFYTASGNELERRHCSYVNDLSMFRSNLDPDAPKPQPVSYGIESWPAIVIGLGLQSGTPGHFIVFKDKHGNRIAHYRYNDVTGKIRYRYKEVESIKELDDLDLSCLKIEKADDRKQRNYGNKNRCVAQ